MTTNAGGRARGVTAREVSDHLAGAFIAPGPSTVDLPDAAIRTRARPALRDALRRLPPRRFDSISDVLAALPVGTFVTAAGLTGVRRSGRRR